MSEEVQRTGGVWLPWPALTLICTLVLALGAVGVGMYAKLDTMNSTMIIRDADQREALRELKNQRELQELQLNDLAKKIAVMQRDLDQQQRRRGGN